MNNHVPSLQTCQRLKELGYPQESEFYWCSFFDFEEKDKPILVYGLDEYTKAKRLAAPLASELLEQLPDRIRNEANGDQTPLWFCKNKYTNDFLAEYHITFSSPIIALRDKSLSEVMAKMWIYLKEKGLI